MAPIGGDATNGLEVDVTRVTGTVTVGGVAAENAAVSGNPALVGGRYDSTPRTLGNGDVGAIALTAEGYVLVEAVGAAVDDSSTLTSGTTEGSPIMAVATPTDGSVDANDFGMLAMSLDRRLLVDAQIAGQDANLTVDLGSTDNAVLDAIAASLVDIETNTNSGAVVGGGVEATALRVTIANDSTGVVSIDDNGGSITVDGATLTAIQTAVEIIDNAISGSEMQVDVVAALPTGSNTIGNIGTIATSVTPGTGATNLGKAEDAAHTTADVGVMGLAVRTDTPANRSGTDGDYEPLQVSAGRLWTSSSITAVVPGTGATNLGKAEDAVHASGDTGVMTLTRRIDTAASSAGTSGDYATFNTDANGKLWVNAQQHAGSTGGASIFRSLDIDETEEDVKTSAGTLYSIHAMNMTASVLYLKFYNATAATVVVGTTTPVMTLPIPTLGDTNGAGFVLSVPTGLAFGTAICVACTTGLADADTGAPAANACVINLSYA